MNTLEDDLIEMGEDTEGTFPCVRCDRQFPAFALAFRDEAGIADSVACTECAIDVQRVATAQAEQTARAELELADPWATDMGVYIKTERVRRIEAARWAVDPLTSPLSEACREQWVAHIRALHRLTLDFAGPTFVEWPSEPVLEYDTTS